MGLIWLTIPSYNPSLRKVRAEISIALHITSIAKKCAIFDCLLDDRSPRLLLNNPETSLKQCPALDVTQSQPFQPRKSGMPVGQSYVDNPLLRFSYTQKTIMWKSGKACLPVSALAPRSTYWQCWRAKPGPPIYWTITITEEQPYILKEGFSSVDLGSRIQDHGYPWQIDQIIL